jgi:hypothetical protein
VRERYWQYTLHHCGDISLMETRFVRVDGLGARQTSSNFGFRTTCFHIFLQFFHNCFSHISWILSRQTRQGFMSWLFNYVVL